MVDVNQLRRNTWAGIERLLAAGGVPREEDLAAAADGDPGDILPLTRVYLVKGRKPIRKRGRSAMKPGEMPEGARFIKHERERLQQLVLVMAVKELAHQLPGDRTEAEWEAIRQIAKTRRKPSPATLRRRYTAACTRWPEVAAATWPDLVAQYAENGAAGFSR